ncbi:unnamed protein product [Strongylus vulgaris]|uniref:Uncharacterized protein n=1 Tax=Strongylus vulgaris TaxID=40348 RepID=A0A3P7HX86_STRVU|nr:unnamed protein product [Strongylus vulgaris]
MSWEETAAAFLAKLGDPKAAARVLDSSAEKDRTTERVSSKSFVDEKIKQLRSLASPLPSTSKEKTEVSLQSESDEKAQMRKMLGVLITMQQEAERNGSLDESVIDKLYREVGLKKSLQTTSDQLLAQICSEISQVSQPTSRPAIDLQSFGISAPPADPPQPPSIFGGGLQSQPLPPTSQPSTIQMLLSEVKRSLSGLKPPRPLSPLIKSPPFVITNRDDVFPEGETISCVFPGADSKELKCGSSANALQPEQNLSKKERAALRKKMLLEEAERLRKQAEEEDGDDDDDDWDCLAEVINRPVPIGIESTSEKYAQQIHESPRKQRDNGEKVKDYQVDEEKKTLDRERCRERRPDDKEVFTDRNTYEREKLNRKVFDKEKGAKLNGGKKTSTLRNEKKLDICQKMPLQRTILPDGSPSTEVSRKGDKISKSQKKKVEREREHSRMVGKPAHWPQPVPQPLLGLSLDPPPREPPIPSSAEVRQLSHNFRVANEPVYPIMGNNPVYPNQYLPVYPNQQQYHNPLYYQDQYVGQSPVHGYGDPTIQQQYFGQPPYY